MKKHLFFLLLFVVTITSCAKKDPEPVDYSNSLVGNFTVSEITTNGQKYALKDYPNLGMVIKIQRVSVNKVSMMTITNTNGQISSSDILNMNIEKSGSIYTLVDSEKTTVGSGGTVTYNEQTGELKGNGYDSSGKILQFVAKR